MYLDLAQRADTSFEQAVQVVQTLYRCADDLPAERWKEVEAQIDRAQQSDTYFERIVHTVRMHYRHEPFGSTVAQESFMPYFAAVPPLPTPPFSTPPLPILFYEISSDSSTRQLRADVSFDEIMQAAQTLCEQSSNGSKERQEAIELLMKLAQRPGTSFAQAVQVAQTLYEYSADSSEEHLLATRTLLQLAQWFNTPLDQATQAAQALYKYSKAKSEEQRQAAERLLDLLQRPDLSIEQAVRVAETIYQLSPFKEEQQQAVQKLWNLAQEQNFTVAQRLSAIKPPLAAINASYADKAKAVRIVCTLLQKEEAKEFLTEHWHAPYWGLGVGIEPLDILSIVELARQELLQTKIRDEMYKVLRDMIPQFGTIETPKN